MYKLKSESVFDMGARGLAYVVNSPVSAARNLPAMREAMGPQVEIDGIVFEPIGYDMFMPATPVHIGERISILVRR